MTSSVVISIVGVGRRAGAGLRRWRESLTVNDVLRLLAEHGWYHVATRGSHRQFKPPWRPGRVTVAGKLGDELTPGTLKSILMQAGLK